MTARHGGPRPNSGRKPRGATARVQVSITLDRATLAEIDRQKGKDGRGAVIDRWAVERGGAAAGIRSSIDALNSIERALWAAQARAARLEGGRE